MAYLTERMAPKFAAAQIEWPRAGVHCGTAGSGGRFFCGLSPKKHRNSMEFHRDIVGTTHFVNGTLSSIVDIYLEIPFSNFLGIHMYM